jgi:hypothetical protein
VERDKTVHNQDKNVVNEDTMSRGLSDGLACEMQRIVRRAGEPWTPGDSVKAAISRAARRLGLSFRRTRSIWYADPRAAIRAYEADELRRREWALLLDRKHRLDAELAQLTARIDEAHASQ